MKLRVSINGNAYDVDVEVLDEGGISAPAPALASTPRAAAPSAPVAPIASAAPAASAGGNALNSPIPGTVVEIKVKIGQQVSPNETVIIIDAMKMNTPVAAPAAGTVKEILVNVGDAVRMGQPLMTFA